MVFEVSMCEEASFTPREHTLVGSFAGVGPHVRFQVAFLAERLRTPLKAAHIRLRASLQLNPRFDT